MRSCLNLLLSSQVVPSIYTISRFTRVQNISTFLLQILQPFKLLSRPQEAIFLSISISSLRYKESFTSNLLPEACLSLSLESRRKEEERNVKNLIKDHETRCATFLVPPIDGSILLKSRSSRRTTAGHACCTLQRCNESARVVGAV